MWISIIEMGPGKMMDLIESRKMSLASVRFFIMDEADRCQ